ncbi:MAG TPA: aldo/keto reductase, partial [Candidatus Nitrosocosmicus sp.]
SERELLPMANALDIGVTAWSPLGNGILTGKYNKKMEKQHQHNISTSISSTSVSSTKVTEDIQDNSNGRLDVLKSMSPDLANTFLTDKNILITEEVIKIAKETGCSPAQVALNWIRQGHDILSIHKNRIIPIIGARKESQIKDNIECIEFELSNEQLKRLDEISRIELGFPHDFLNSKMVNEIIYGNISIHNHRK